MQRSNEAVVACRICKGHSAKLVFKGGLADGLGLTTCVGDDPKDWRIATLTQLSATFDALRHLPQATFMASAVSKLPSVQPRYYVVRNHVEGEPQEPSDPTRRRSFFPMMAFAAFALIVLAFALLLNGKLRVTSTLKELLPTEQPDELRVAFAQASVAHEVDLVPRSAPKPTQIHLDKGAADNQRFARLSLQHNANAAVSKLLMEV